MRLQSLELQGFKSFPDKTRLDFDRGLTAVVGPNGSGKSNIGDAVRWVLGEQSSRTLRGGRMEDVIFGGTEKRRPVSFASVTLNIENGDRLLAVEEDLVSVTRKLYRNGDSEYMINGSPVRLRDIVELFMDTGLGRDGYSIIGQGRVADIISSKSNERREIFEEAAGISKFRYKKQEAERKLASSEDNLLRLGDILSELEARLEPLRAQSEKAQRYLELAGKRKKLEISLWADRLSELDSAGQRINDDILVGTSELEIAEGELSSLEAEINELILKRRQCSVFAEESRRESQRISQELSEHSKKAAVYENNIMHYNSQLKELEQKRKELSKASLELEKSVEEKSLEIDKILLQIKEAKSEILESEGELSRLDEESGRLQSELHGSSDRLGRMYIRRSELSYTIESSRSSLNTSTQELEQLREQGASLEHRLSELAGKREELSRSLQEAKSLCEMENNRLAGYNLLYGKKSESKSRLEAEYNQTELSYGGTASKRQLLLELENSMEGFGGSVRSVTAAARAGRLRGVRGAVGSLISVESGYSLAIETALGASLQNIIVENEESAKASIRYLMDTGKGRATFLPITTIKPSRLSEGGLESEEGFISVASGLVSCDNEYRAIVEYLLGRIVVSENIDLAAKMARKHGYRFKIITLDGQVINSGGSFTGGSVSKSAGILSRKNEIALCDRELSELEKKRESLKSRLDACTSELTRLGFELDSQKEKIREAESSRVQLDTELEALSPLELEIKSRLSETELLIGENLSRADSLKESEMTASAELESLAGEIDSLESFLAEANKKSSQEKERRELLSAELSNKRLRLLELEKNKESAEYLLSSLRGGINSSKAENEENIEREKKIASMIESERLAIESLEHDSRTLRAKIEELGLRTKSELDSSLEYERQENLKREEEKISVRKKEELGSKLSGLKERLLSFNKERESIITELWEEYSLSLADAMSQAEELESRQSASKRLYDIKAKIRELGSVNTEAIDEYREVKERHAFLKDQLDDVKKSKASLEKLISELTKTMRERFADSFNKINQAFGEIFVELFGGGSGELTLTDPEDALESGIEISVAPPGKVIKSLSLLSGGEQAFVAIAIYFAILRLRPSPFCILDEIEAALDDVNVTKYAQYLRRYVGTTQFILITHRRGTMEEADVLYGVTMQEKGVSRLLRLDLGEVSPSWDIE